MVRVRRIDGRRWWVCGMERDIGVVVLRLIERDRGMVRVRYVRWVIMVVKELE